jgi:hypothetical protein
VYDTTLPSGSVTVNTRPESLAQVSSVGVCSLPYRGEPP